MARRTPLVALIDLRSLRADVFLPEKVQARRSGSRNLQKLRFLYYPENGNRADAELCFARQLAEKFDCRKNQIKLLSAGKTALGSSDRTERVLLPANENEPVHRTTSGIPVLQTDLAVSQNISKPKWSRRRFQIILAVTVNGQKQGQEV